MKNLKDNEIAIQEIDKCLPQTHCQKCGFVSCMPYAKAIVKKNDGKLGVLSVDIDGNDYWILKKLLIHFKPEIICVEYNASFLKHKLLMEQLLQLLKLGQFYFLFYRYNLITITQSHLHPY